MSLYKRGSIWWVEFETGGRRVRRSTGTADKKAAAEYENRLRNQAWRLERLGERPPVTWAEALQKWLMAKPRGLPDRYRLRALDVLPSEELPFTTGRMEELLSGLTSGSFIRLHAILGSIHRAAGVEPPKVKRPKPTPARTRWLTAKEWKTLLKVLEAESPLLAQCARFSVFTGLRENNVLNLRWDQVNLNRAVAFIEATETKQKASIGVPLTPQAIAVLEERRGLDKVWVFAHPDSGQPLTKASNRAWYKAVKSAGMEGFRYHDLRHTWASWAVQSGVRIEELQQLGGWKTLSMVQRYSHLSPGHLAKVAAKIRPVKA